MLRFFYPGQPILQWLQVIEIDDWEKPEDPIRLRACCTSVVWQYKGRYYWFPVFSKGPLVTLSGTAGNLTIKGQSPSGKPRSDLRIYLTPLLPTWAALCILALIAVIVTT